MTTLAELVAQDPDPSWGVEIPVTYGAGTWRFAFLVADPRQGSSIEWHPDLTDHVSEMFWSRGSAQPRSRSEATTPVVMIAAEDDEFAPWNPDTSATFGVHVPLRTGLLMRATVFRVVDSAVVDRIDLFTSRVEIWGDQSAANGGVRIHRVQGFDTRSYLNRRPIPVQAGEGWYERIAGSPNGILETVAWPFGSAIYGAQTSDAVTTLLLPDTEANASGTAAIDQTLDPVGLVWRTLPDGSFVAHPPPWDTFHGDLFAGMTTIVGDEWTPRIESYYPGGPVFSYDPVDLEIPFVHEVEGRSFGVDSNGGNVLNMWEITHPIDVTDLSDGYEVSAYDVPTSDTYHGPRPMPSASWLAENDQVQEDFIDANAFTDLTAAPMMIDADHPGVFPAIALLDHFDPIQGIKHCTRPADARSVLTVSGPLRRIEHSLRFADEAFQWTAEVFVDVDAEDVSLALLPVEDLAVSSITHQSAQFAWENPSGQPVAPTETQIRITQNSTVWLERSYPGVGAGGVGWAGLPHATFLTFEVRLARRVDGLITAVSPVRSISFTTAPTPIPAPPPGGDGTVVVIDDDEFDEECVQEWELQRSDDGTTWTTVASGDLDDFTFDEETGTWTLDNSDYEFEAGYTYRRRFREDCGEGFTEWVVGDTFGDPECTTPDIINDPPYDEDLIAFVPKVCGPNVHEAISDALAAHGPAWGGIGLGETGDEIALYSNASQGVVAYGACNDHDPTAPLSVGWKGSLGAVPTDGDPVSLNAIHGAHIMAWYEDSTHWVARAMIILANGSELVMAESDPLDLDTVYDLKILHDTATGDITMLVDAEVSATYAGVFERRNTLPIWQMQLPANSWATNCAAWGSAIAVGGFDPATLFDHLWWPGGAEFQALGYANTDPVTAFPDEVGSANFSTTSTGWTYAASVSDLNNRPAVQTIGGSIKLATFSGISPTYSIVTILVRPAFTAGYLMDGTGAGNRAVLFGGGSGSAYWSISFGNDLVSATARDGLAHGIRIKIVSGSSDVLSLDGTTIATGNGGDHTLNGLTLGGAFNASQLASGVYALIGVYAGDITADPDWAAFQAWALSHFGVDV